MQNLSTEPRGIVMRSYLIEPIKYEDKSLIFSYCGARRGTYIYCEADKRDRVLLGGVYGMFGAYCSTFKERYIKCLRYMYENSKGVIVYA